MQESTGEDGMSLTPEQMTSWELVEVVKSQADEISSLRADLGNLLAIIHRDGGHHQAAVGTKQAVADAHLVWAGLMTKLAKAVEALKPFAALKSDIENCASTYAEGSPERDMENWVKACAWEDLLRAANALKEIQE